MSLLEAFFLGIVQALTEFLPISSSGHLILVSHLLKGQASPLLFDLVLHAGTALALLVVFGSELLVVLKSFSSDFFSKKFKFKSYSQEGIKAVYIGIACLPAVLVGVLFGDLIEGSLRTVQYVLIFLIIGTILLITAELYGGKQNTGQTLKTSSSIVIGLFQVLALLPGMSRSGSTISAGMLVGLTRESAAKFSFLMSVPLVLAASCYELYSSWDSVSSSMDITYIVGFATSFVTGVVVIRLLLKYLSHHSLWVFIIYRILLVMVLALLL